MKICRECKWHCWDNGEDACSHPELAMVYKESQNPVTGEAIPAHTYVRDCEVMRTFDAMCGTRGRLWESKEPRPESAPQEPSGSFGLIDWIMGIIFPNKSAPR